MFSIFGGVALIAVLGVFLFNQSKPKTVDSIPEFWHNDLLEHVLFYKNLSLEEEQTLFLEKMRQFLSETHVESVHFKLEPLDVMLVAASAVIPVFCFDNFQYTNLILKIK